MRVGIVLFTFMLLVGTAGSPAVAQQSAADLEARFAEMMSGVRLEGEFSVDLPSGQSPPPQQDLYMVSELTRGEGATWIFHASMSYGDNMNVTIPIPVEVLWAGDTPVLTMTDQTIEGIGTFTVRLLLFEGRYAGTWQNGPIGGHMWGDLVPVDEEAAGEGTGTATPASEGESGEG